MDLFILRHGEAGKRTASRGNDTKRPLTAVGEKEITEIAESLEKIGIKFDVILTSPLKRAQQTADLVAKQFMAQRKLR
jgi:phosphohistidine phosphatase